MTDDDRITGMIQWFRERPASIRRLAQLMPCGALVKAKSGHTFVVPGPGKTAEVVGYTEGGEFIVEGASFLGQVTSYVTPDTVEFVGWATGTATDLLQLAYAETGMTWPTLKERGN